MRIVKEIIRSSFLIFLLSTIFVEIIIIIFFHNTYSSPVEGSFELFNKSSNDSLHKGLTSISNLFSQKLGKIIYNLLFIGKQLSMFSNNTAEIQVLRNSEFYSSFKDCVISVDSSKDLIENEKYIKYYDSNQKKFNYLQTFLQDYNGKDQNTIIREMINLLPLKQISYHKTGGGSDVSQLSQEFIHSVCSAVSIMKSMYIKEMLSYGNTTEIEKFSIIQDDKILIYPPHYYQNSFLFNALASCTNETFPKCLNYTETNNQSTKYQLKIIYTKTLAYLNICISVPFDEKLALLCGEINFSSILENYKITSENVTTIGFFNESYSSKETYQVFYTNIDIENEKYNNPKFNEHQLNESNSQIDLFHLLYNDVNFTNIDNISNITKEFNFIRDKIIQFVRDLDNENSTNIKYFDANKSFSPTESIDKTNSNENDTFLIGISSISTEMIVFNDKYLINKNIPYKAKLFYVIFIIKLTPTYYSKWIKSFFLYKNLRLFALYIVTNVFLSITFYIFSVTFFNYLMSSIRVIQEDFTNYNNSSKFSGFENVNFLEKKERKKNLEEEKNTFEQFLKSHTNAKNKEMTDLENTFDTMKKIIFLKRIITNNNLQYHKKNFIKFLETIKDEEIRQISTLILAYSNFQDGKYYSAMKEINSLILNISQKEVKLLNSTDNFDAQIKDMISRFSEIAYINEYSNFKGLNENVIPVIKMKQLSQKLFYLLAICKYRHIVESRGNLLKKPSNMINTSLPLEEAIDYFKRVRTINHSIGMNPIKEIYSLIMLAKSNIYHHDHKAAKNILNEALLFYNEILKLFKDNYHKYFFPKIMLFTFNFIFQNLMLTIAQCLYENNKLCNAGFICLKIFETSPFLHKTIHKEATNLLCNILKDLKSDYSGTSNINEGTESTNNANFRVKKKTTEGKESQKMIRLFNKNMKLFDKIHSRLGVKKKTIKKKDFSSANTGTNNANSFKETTLKETKMSNVNLLGNDNLFINNSTKEIIICLSEKAILSFHGSELLDVLIQYLQDYFGNSENDLFSFIQFSSNGKKTVFFKQLGIIQFIQKLQMNKNVSDIVNNQQSQKMQFKQLYNILDSCIKSVSVDVKGDNIILLFIESEDIRFSSIKECVNIVNELNEGNFTLIIFSCEEFINENKIKNIKIFLSGLTEGYFLHVKNFQIIQQVFMNIGSNEKMEDFFSYEYENIQNILI